MKYVRIVGLLALAAAALMAVAASASATTVTSTTGETPTIIATSEGATSLDGTVEVTCSHSEVVATVTAHGTGVTVKAHINKLTYTECGDDHVTVLRRGTIEAHAISPTGNATLTWSGMETTVEADTIFGDVHCIYTTNNSHLGTFTGASGSGGHATVHLESTALPRTGGSFLCGSGGEVTGSYKIIHPTGLAIH